MSTTSALVVYITTLLFSTTDAGGYSIYKDWQGSSFFDGWHYSTRDMTGGVVDYGKYSDLAYYNPSTDSAIIKVDNKGGTTSMLFVYNIYHYMLHICSYDLIL